MASRPVDERIVKMRFENQDFKAKADETGTILVRLRDALNKIPGVNIGKTAQDMAQISKEADRVNMGRLATAVEAVSNKFSALGIIGITALQNITNEAINAGKGLANSLSGLEGMKSGFKEYELKMGAVQTIMAGSGEDLDTVNEALEKLNQYADKTIYSFSNMTQNIGKFTNAGVSLDRSVKAIQGVSNVAALSGANAEQASMAMYNFSQALSSGSVKNIDWKSIETAQMSTKAFRQELLNTALAMGTVKKTSDGMYKSTTKNGMGQYSNHFDAMKGFKEELDAAWLTSDVLVATLGKYSDATTEIGKRAFAAAQDVKTFTQLIDTTKEAIGSGWAQSWEIVIGDFAEAKSLWSGLNAIISGAVGRSAGARNAFLKSFKDAGGIKNITTGFGNVFKSLQKIINAIGLAFKGAFPPKTTQQIVKLTEIFAEMTGKLIVSDVTAEKIRATFYNLFSTIKTGIGWVKTLGKELVKMIPSDFGDKVVETLKWFTGLVSGFAESINLGTRIPQVFSGISSAFGWLGTKAKELSGFIGDVVEYIKSIFTGVDTPKIESTFNIFESIKTKLDEFRVALDPTWQAIKEFFANVTAQDILSGGVLLVAFNFLKKLMDFLNLIKSPKDFGKAIEPVLNTVSDSVNAFTKNTPYDKIQKVATSLLLLAGSMKILESIDPERIDDGLKIMAGSLAGIVAFMWVVDKLEVDAFTGGGMLTTLYGIGFTLVLMSVALKNISTIDPKRLNDSVWAAIKLFGVLTLAFVAIQMVSSKFKVADGTGVAFKRFASGLIKMAVSVSIFAIGFQIMANALKAIGTIDPDAFDQGLVGIGILLLAIGGSQFLSGVGGGNAISSAIGLAIVAKSLTLLVEPLTTLGTMKYDTMMQGIIAISLAVMILAGSLFLAKGGLGGAVGMYILVKVLEQLIPVITTIGGLEMDKVALGVGAIVVVALGLAGALMMAAKGSKGTAGLVLAALALSVLSVQLIALSKVPMGGIFLALGALAGALLILAIAAATMAPFVAIIYVLGTTIFKMGLGLLFGAAALAIFGPALAVFAVVVAGSAVVIVAAIGSILDAIIWLAPKVEDAFVVLIEMLCGAIIRSIPPIGDAVGMLVVGIIMVLLKYIDPIADALTLGLVILIESLNNALVKYGPRFIKSIMVFIGEILVLLAEAVAAVLEVIIGWIPGMNKRMEKNLKETNEIIRDAFDADVLAVEVGEDLKKSIEGGGGGAFQEAGEAAGEKTTGGFLESIGNFDFGKIGTGAAGVFGESFGKFDFPGIGENGMSEIMSGFGSGEEGMQKQIDSMLMNLGMKTNVKPLEETGKKAVKEFAGGVKLAGPMAAFETKKVADAAAAELAAKAKEAKRIAEDFINGYLLPFKTRRKEVANAAADLGVASTKALKNTLKERSPSRVTKQSGNYFVQGFINGIRDKISGAKEAVITMANNATSAMNTFIDQFAGTFQEDNEYAVSLKPVLDLSGMGTLPNQTYGVSPDTSRTGNLFNQVASAYGQNGNKNIQTLETQKIQHDVNVKVVVEGPPGFSNDQKLADKIKTVLVNEISVGNRTVPNKTSIFPFG